MVRPPSHDHLHHNPKKCSLTPSNTEAAAGTLTGGLVLCSRTLQLCVCQKELWRLTETVLRSAEQNLRIHGIPLLPPAGLLPLCPRPATHTHTQSPEQEHSDITLQTHSAGWITDFYCCVNKPTPSLSRKLENTPPADSLMVRVLRAVLKVM